jgi:hypothetical protein
MEFMLTKGLSMILRSYGLVTDGTLPLLLRRMELAKAAKTPTELARRPVPLRTTADWKGCHL